MKMIHADPKHSGLSHGNTVCEPAKDGTIEVPAEAVEAAKSHGFVPFIEESEDASKKPLKK